MKLIPILFSTPMVQALLEERKTMTRRIIKPQPIIDEDSGFVYSGDHKHLYKNDVSHEPWQNRFVELCRYQPGDVLWVKESHFLYGHWKKNGITKTGKQKWRFVQDPAFTSIAYNDHPPYKVEKNSFRGTGWYKRNSLFMTKAASRITLMVKSIRVERLQSITWKDIEAEGIVVPPAEPFSPTHGELWTRLWVEINGEENFYSNPWVWVVEFARTEKPVTNA